jgi:hypothetical protein
MVVVRLSEDWLDVDRAATDPSDCTLTEAVSDAWDGMRPPWV